MKADGGIVVLIVARKLDYNSALNCIYLQPNT